MDQESFLRVPAQLKQLAAIRRFIERTADSLSVDSETLSDIIQSVDEAATNIIVHGYRGQAGEIEVRIVREGNDLFIRLLDWAPPFDPTLHPNPDLSLPLHVRPYGGMGIYLIRQYMDDLIYRRLPQGGNELTLVKKAAIRNSPIEGGRP